MDDGPFLPFLQHHLANRALSVIPFSSPPKGIAEHIADFFRHEIRQPFQLILLIDPGYGLLPVLSGLKEICDETIYLNALILYDRHDYPYDDALIQVMPQKPDSLYEVTPHFSLTCFPYNDGNVSEKLISQRNLLLFIEQLIHPYQEDLPLVLAKLDHKYHKASLDINNETFMHVFHHHLHKLSSGLTTLHTLATNHQQKKVDIRLYDPDTDPGAADLPVLRLSGFRFPWPMQPALNFKGFKIPLNNWLNAQQQKLEDYQEACRDVLSVFYKHCLMAFAGQKEKSVSVDEEIEKTKRAISEIRKKISGIQAVVPDIQRQSDHIRKNYLPPLVNGLNMIPTWKALAVFACISFGLFTIVNYMTYSGTTTRTFLLVVAALLGSGICIYVSLKFFIFNSVKSLLSGIAEHLADIQNSIIQNARSGTEEIIGTIRLRLHVRNLELLEAKKANMQHYAKCCHYHEKIIQSILLYWKALYSAYPLDYDDNIKLVSEEDVERAPEEINFYDLGDSFTETHKTEIFIDGKSVISNSRLNGLLERITIIPIGP